MSKVQWLGQVRPPQPEPVHPVIANAEKMIALAGGPRVEHLGEPADDGSTWAVTWTFLSMAGAALAAYHGYKRNHESTGAAVGWGVLGGLFPIITVPVALAQGYGKPAGARDNPESFEEIGKFTYAGTGQTYEAGGAFYDKEHGVLAGYVRDLGEGRYWLIKWDGGTITSLRLVRKHRGGFGRQTMYAWSAEYDGKRFHGRNLGPNMLLRMRAGRRVK